MKQITTLLLFLLSMPILSFPQNTENQSYKSAFKAAYQACPDIPQGWLEAISFTNTHCNHLTDANYFHDGPDAMPRATVRAMSSTTLAAAATTGRVRSIRATRSTRGTSASVRSATVWTTSTAATGTLCALSERTTNFCSVTGTGEKVGGRGACGIPSGWTVNEQ